MSLPTPSKITSTPFPDVISLMRETMESVDVSITWSAPDSSDACALTGLDAVPIIVYGPPGDWDRICVRREPVPPDEA